VNGFEGEITKGDMALRMHMVKEGREHDDRGFARQRVSDEDGRRVCVGEFGGLWESDECCGQAARRWARTRGGDSYEGACGSTQGECGEGRCGLWRAADKREYGSVDGSSMDSVE